MKYSLIIPVYNRPQEVQELLESVKKQTFKGNFDVIVVEDGSQISSREVVHSFENDFSVKYLYKPNSGPGSSRNYGMKHSDADYFIILDSDCILPENYLLSVDDFLENNFVDCFGGADADLDDFTDIQKAINYAMTSFLTTGGIRGSRKSVAKFEPRSFNMGLSKKAFWATGGFGTIHPGEDPDLTIRLWKMGFQTAFVPEAFVYHKRRISWEKFRKQVSKFGRTRPILNHWHPEYKKLIYWLPVFFAFGLLISALTFIFFPLGLMVYVFYFLLILFHASLVNKSLKIGALSVFAVCVQFVSYGLGFLHSTLLLSLFAKEKTEKELFPDLFFKEVNL